MYNKRVFDNKQGVYVPKLKPKLDELYVYRTSSDIPFRKKQQNAEYKYTDSGSIVTSNFGEIFTYAQTVTIDGVKRGLLMISKEARKTVIEKFFKEAVKSIKEDKLALEKFKKATKPQTTGIKYQ